MRPTKVFVKDSKAVSPVIGVMLMVVVTVILAAAVSAYSGGLMSSSEKAPSAVFEVDVAVDASDDPMGVKDYLSIKHVTGDPIATSDLKIVTINPNAEGVQERELLPGDDKTFGAFEFNGTIPYLNDMNEGGFGDNPDVDFGNYTLRPGRIMVAQDYPNDDVATWNTSSGDYDGTDEIGQFQHAFADSASISQGDFVTIKILHTPSDSVIYDTKIMVR